MTSRTTGSTPSLAVIIPCFNNAETLREAIESALDQDYPDYSIYVCDNGSSDESPGIIAGYRSPKLKPRLHSDTLPRTDNWNRAYEAGSDADYLVTLHADDRLAPASLRAIGRAAGTRPALIHGRFRKITYDGVPVPGPRFPLGYLSHGESFQELLLLNNMVAMPGVTIRTDVFARAGRWDPAWQYLQDAELWWRCGEIGDVAYIADQLGDHRAYKEPQALHRHAEEHLRWATEKLRTVRTARLRQAAADGLSAYLARLEEELTALPMVAPPLSAGLALAKQALAGGPSPRPNATGRQRVLRGVAALRSMPSGIRRMMGRDAKSDLRLV